MKELVTQLVPECLSIGITLEEFWSMDLQEIRLVFEGYQKKQDRQNKDILFYCYQIATMTSTFVSLGLSGKQPPRIEEVYPGIFNTEGTGVSKEEQFKHEIIAYAELFNMKRQKEMGDNINDNK